MKIALIDNMNNNFFSFARYLRDLGQDAHLFIMPNMDKHFLPENDTFMDLSTVDWIHTWPFSVPKDWYFFCMFGKEKIRKLLSGYDLIVACGYALSYLAKANITVDVAIPYGSDIYDLTKYRQLCFAPTKLVQLLKDVTINQLVPYQIKAFQDAKVVVFNTEDNEEFKVLKDDFGVQTQDLGIPMIYLEQRQACQSYQWLKSHDFVLMSHARHFWSVEQTKGKFSSDIKNNDRLIRAFAKFIKQTNFAKPILILFEYGPDVENSKSLIRELGIEAQVHWMNIMPRKEILNLLEYVHLGADQFLKGLCGIGGVVLEFFAKGVPVLTYGNGGIQNKKSFYHNAPIIEVLTETEILSALLEYEQDPQKYQALSKASLDWFNKKVGVNLVKNYLALFETLVINKGNKKAA